MHTTPKKINRQLESLISKLGLDPSSAVWLKQRRVSDFVPETKNCLINCMVQEKYQGGKTVYGWVLWQDSSIGFCEAEFHCNWQDSSGNIHDITPRVDGEKRVCFIPDPNRESYLDRSVYPHITRTYENFKMHGTNAQDSINRLEIKLNKEDLLKHLNE